MLWVRDDILTAIYPEARTLSEIMALYEANGAFTREEIFDVPLNTLDDFVGMLGTMFTIM